VRHILRSNSNTATTTAPPATTTTTTNKKDARLPPSGRPTSVHALANKKTAPQSSDVTSPPPISEQNEFSGLISRAKEGLSASSSSSLRSSSTFHQKQAEQQQRLPDKSETQIQWDEIEKNLARSLKVFMRYY